jgi:hypothetical protein
VISIIGIGTGASKIAQRFAEITQYDVYTLNDKVDKNTESEYRLEKFNTPEEYENNIPDLKSFFKNLKENVQVFVVGSTYSSNYSLGILQQIKNKNIEVFYIKPDMELVTGERRLMENVVFGVLQEYARSGLFHSFTCFSNLEVEKMIGNVPIKGYYDKQPNTLDKLDQE